MTMASLGVRNTVNTALTLPPHDRTTPTKPRQTIKTMSSSNSSVSKPPKPLKTPQDDHNYKTFLLGELPPGLRRELMPRHVAVIMDGNARWARHRGLPEAAGHEAGVRSLRLLIDLCCKWGIVVLTVFAFSHDNWNRPKVEVEFLMGLFEREIKSRLDEFLRERIRVSTIGDLSRLPMSLRKVIADAEETTKENSGLQLVIALSYSGKYDIVQACRSVAEKVKEGYIQLDEIDETLMEQELETSCTQLPCPDLLIRTSGELRVSNFFLWQLAYAELFFTTTFWPDFGEADFLEALDSFQKRERRYGRRTL